MSGNDVVITGIGLVSCLGNGKGAHRQALVSGVTVPPTDSETFAPYTVHRLPEIDWSEQIPKRGDLRQMELWQRLGTYTAGLALDDAGVKNNEEVCGSMDMIVAAGGGERDLAVDALILDGAKERNDRALLINEILTTELRPTLFLAQLSNLLAGNISIVHKVTGSSRTFMGEEGAGVSALDVAIKRIRSGRRTHALVGAAYQTEHPDMLLGYELGDFLHQGPWKPLWQRGAEHGEHVITGSGAAFLVIEAADYAAERGAKAYASLGDVKSSMVDRTSGDFAQDISKLAGEAGFTGSELIMSAATGAKQPTNAEKKALASDNGAAIRGFSGLTGQMKEVQFPFAVALAALAVDEAIAVPAFDSEMESEFSGSLDHVLATSIGTVSAEGAVMVSSAGNSKVGS